MARIVNAAGMLDIRSATILQDFIYASSPCLPGATETKTRRYYNSGFFRDLPANADARNPKKYDRTKDWIAMFCSFTICLVTFGILHSSAMSHPRAIVVHGFGFVEINVVTSFMLTIVLIFGPLAAFSVRNIGHRLTCIFGMLLLFIGLMLDALEIHKAVFLISHILLIGIGASFTITAALSAVVDHFREHIQYALCMMSCSAPIGTIIFFLLTYFLGIYGRLTYKWMTLAYAIIVLVLIAATHALPPSIRPLRHPDPFHVKKVKQRTKAIQECIANNVKRQGQGQRGDCEDPKPAENLKDTEDHKSCLCVCVCDISILTDLSFLLWAGISSAAMMTVYVPYLLLVFYAAEDHQILYWDAFCLILWFCAASIVTRLCVVLGTDHTLTYNRSVFQAVILGIMYYSLASATTYGWLMCWCLVMGAIEGILMSVIPRITIQTIPRKHMICSWSYIVVFHGVAVMIGPYLFASTRTNNAGDIFLACLVIGLAQIIAGLLAFLLPDEEDVDEPVVIDPSASGPEPYMSQRSSGPRPSGGRAGRSGYSRRAPNNPYASRCSPCAYPSSPCPPSLLMPSRNPYGSLGVPPRPCCASGGGTDNIGIGGYLYKTCCEDLSGGTRETYSCNCPICTKLLGEGLNPCCSSPCTYAPPAAPCCPSPCTYAPPAAPCCPSPCTYAPPAAPCCPSPCTSTYAPPPAPCCPPSSTSACPCGPSRGSGMIRQTTVTVRIP